MDFYKLIKSLDELVFELLSWLFFYPRTFWRMLVAPVETMRSVERELRDDEEHRFDELLGPPLFLAITLVLIHLVELKVFPENSSSGAEGPVAEFLADDTNLLAFRIFLFGILPLLAAAKMLKRRGKSLDKNNLRAPFYAQCYAAAVFTILVNGAVFSAQGNFGNPAAVLGGGLLFSVVWLGWVEARWFHRKLGYGRAKAFLDAVIIMVEWLVAAMIVGILVF